MLLLDLVCYGKKAPRRLSRKQKLPTRNSLAKNNAINFTYPSPLCCRSVREWWWCCCYVVCPQWSVAVALLAVPVAVLVAVRAAASLDHPNPVQTLYTRPSSSQCEAEVSTRRGFSPRVMNFIVVDFMIAVSTCFKWFAVFVAVAQWCQGSLFIFTIIIIYYHRY